MPRISTAQSSVFAALLCGFFLLRGAPTLDGRSFGFDDKATAAEPQSKDAHPVLVELFTSEGCSSCPPADALLEKMDGAVVVPGAPLIVLSEHVDYWDHDGWKDANSSSALTDRQAAYVRTLGVQAPYTPELVVDGSSEMHANDPQEMNKVLQAAAAAPKVPVHIGEVSVDAGNPAVLRTRVEVDGESSEHNAEVYVAVALDRVESQVLHGENGGKRLTHVAVVQQLIKIGKLRKGKAFDESVQLKLKPGTDPKNIRIVAFVQESGPGKLLGAALRKPAS
ncbi:MAG: DUF1223 domain-containing protein [Candidatus Sulfotelmatobacter sp.]